MIPNILSKTLNRFEMKYRNQLYAEAKSMIKNWTPQKESILFHNIYTLNVGGFYPFSSKQDVLDLVEFLNSYE